MATKTIVTRIKNKVADLSSWQNSTGKLLDGEIALVRVPTGDTYTNPITGAAEPVIELLMKVGDGNSSFGDLPWLSAKASDVYNWAKLADPSSITVSYNGKSSTLANVLKDLQSAQADIAELEEDLGDVRTLFSVDPATATANGVVQGVTYDSSTGKFTVSYGTVATADLGSKVVTAAKIADKTVTATQLADKTVTAAKIADSTITNDKISSVSSSKVTTDSDGTTLATKLSAMDATIAGKMDTHTHPYLPDSTTYAGSSTKGGAATSANKVNAAVTFNNGGSGAASGTTFDGSAAKTISYNTIGAAPATHSHDDLYYTETEINSKISEINTAIGKKSDSGHNHDDVYIKPADVDTKISTALGSVLKYKGTKTNTSSLPTSGNATGDVWNITNACAASGTLPKVNAGDNVAWNGSAWDVLAGTVDLSSYYNKSEVNAELAKKSDTEHTHNYAGSSSAGGAATSANKVNKAVTFNNSGSGVASGTTFDGSTARTVSYNTIGAAAASHTHTKSEITDFAHDHDDRYYTESEINALLEGKSGTDHTHSTYVNQNAFSNIKVSKSGGGSSDVTVAADTATDTVTFVGSNVTITGDATNDKVTFAVADGTTSAKGLVQLEDSVASTSTTTAATPNSVKTAYDKAAAAEAALANKAASSHTHGNILNGGTMTATALTATTGVAGVLVTDSNNKITRMSPTTVRSLIGAGTSSLTIGTTSTTAAAGNHTHSTHEARTTAIEGDYVRYNSTTNMLYVGKSGADEIIFDCGGAPV